MEVTSRVTNVVETRTGDVIKYFTLEGVFIGELRGGARVATNTREGTESAKPAKSGVVKSITPEQVRRNKELETRELVSDPKARAKHLAKNVA